MSDELRPKEVIESEVVEALKTIFDPEIPVNIYELGLIYNVDVRDDRSVEVRLTLTSPMCPVAGTLPPEVEVKVAQVDRRHRRDRRSRLGSALGTEHDVGGGEARTRNDVTR